ncbi:MAG: cob(I)yrinic acid a,c-diamide adenosyltransferase [Desulfobacteraceae bacterium]|nr:cob(I)yrinic acid a,c-diamide adenosyltransferase [Desulfobacteraceae bacterium]MCF8037647.1 cob(I)yrinic acid a,c-diamide adenosyltransferase [Desulfobacteraceae bacterium]
MENPKVEVFTGNGKGKTTAAMGVAIQAAGKNLQVFILQFNKKGDYSEIKALKHLSEWIQIEQFGLGRFTWGKPESEDIQAAREGLKRAKEIIFSDQYDLVILDEANVAVKYGLIPEQELVNLVVNKPPRLNLLITGRYVSSKIVSLADSVTEFKVRKHYMEKGVPAREGIEF